MQIGTISINSPPSTSKSDNKIPVLLLNLIYELCGSFHFPFNSFLPWFLFSVKFKLSKRFFLLKSFALFPKKFNYSTPFESLTMSWTCCKQECLCLWKQNGQYFFGKKFGKAWRNYDSKLIYAVAKSLLKLWLNCALSSKSSSIINCFQSPNEKFTVGHSHPRTSRNEFQS